jgi:N-methylhydantoinase B
VWLNKQSPEWLDRKRHEARYLGAVFSNLTIHSGDSFTRSSSGGGGYGDPLLRDPQAVLEDVTDGYVTPERARLDYGVILREVSVERAEWEIDERATEQERRWIRDNRLSWLDEDPDSVAEGFRRGEVYLLDVIRRYGVILDWQTGEVLPRTTRGFRAMLKRRMVPHWTPQQGTPAVTVPGARSGLQHTETGADHIGRS